MLHVYFRHGQAWRARLAALACACLLSIGAAAQSVPADAQAEALARGGRHLEAGAR